MGIKANFDAKKIVAEGLKQMDNQLIEIIEKVLGRYEKELEPYEVDIDVTNGVVRFQQQGVPEHLLNRIIADLAANGIPLTAG